MVYLMTETHHLLGSLQAALPEKHCHLLYVLVYMPFGTSLFRIRRIFVLLFFAIFLFGRIFLYWLYRSWLNQWFYNT